MSVFVGLRLTDAEAKMLDWIQRSDNSGFENNAEVFRCLLWREFNRRKNLPAPKVADYQSVFRLGSGSRKGKT